MKRKNECTLREALLQFLADHGLEDRINEQRVRHLWPRLFGSVISKHTRSLAIRRKVLYVEVDSAPLREHMHWQRSLIIGRINEAIAPAVIADLVVR